MCCTRLTANDAKKTQKIAICTPSHKFVKYLLSWIFATKACIDNPKNLLDSNTFSICSHNGELRPISGWDRFTSLEHPSRFQRVSHGFVTAPTTLNGRQPNLHDLWPSHGLVHIHFRGLLSPWRNFATCKIHFASKSCVLLLAALPHGTPAAGSAKLCGAVQGRDYGTYAEGAT